MKRNLLYISFTLIISFGLKAQVSINNSGAGPDSSAILDISSESKGLLIPRMTTDQRLAIAQPVEGLMVYDLIENSAFYFLNNSWIPLSMPIDKIQMLSIDTGNGMPVNNYSVIADFENNKLRLINVDSLLFSDGSFQVTAAQSDVLKDLDGDTRIDVEGSGDEDIISFDVKGLNYLKLDGSRIDIRDSLDGIFIGQNAGQNATGVRNFMIGKNAGRAGISSFDNLGIGVSTLEDLNTGNHNLAIGNYSLNKLTAGSENIGIGVFAMNRLQTGARNLAIGVDVLQALEIGSDNTAVGDYCMFLSDSGNQNTTLGAKALWRHRNGDGNTALGYRAGQYSSGNQNIFLGSRSGIEGTFDHRLYIDNDSTETPLIYGEMDNDILIFNGKVGVNTTNPISYQFQVGESGDGSEARANAWNTFSDRRYKEDFEIIPNALQKISQIHGYYYHWKSKSDTSTQVGVIAQEIEEVLPEIVSTDIEGYKSVDYSKLTALLIEGMKEQQMLINDQNKVIALQNARLTDLETKIESIKEHGSN